MWLKWAYLFDENFCLILLTRTLHGEIVTCTVSNSCKEPEDILQWNLDLTRCQGTGEVRSLYRGFVISNNPHLTNFRETTSLFQAFGWKRCERKKKQPGDGVCVRARERRWSLLSPSPSIIPYFFSRSFTSCCTPLSERLEHAVIENYQNVRCIEV